MKSRMDRYASVSTVSERTEKNEKLYNEMKDIDDINVDFIDIDDISQSNTLDISDVNKVSKTREDYRRLREYNNVMGNEYETEPQALEMTQEHKVYDINELLEKAKKNSLFDDMEDKKRVINTEYNILTKLNLDDTQVQKEMSKENLKNLINTVYGNQPSKEVEEGKPLLSDLLEEPKDNDEKLSESISKDILDNTTPHDTDEKSKEEIANILNETFTNINLENTDKVEEEFNDIEKNNKLITIIGVVFGLLIVAGIVFVLIKYMSTF